MRPIVLMATRTIRFNLIWYKYVLWYLAMVQGHGGILSGGIDYPHVLAVFSVHFSRYSPPGSGLRMPVPPLIFPPFSAHAYSYPTQERFPLAFGFAVLLTIMSIAHSKQFVRILNLIIDLCCNM